jgi:hypothetical protein
VDVTIVALATKVRMRCTSSSGRALIRSNSPSSMVSAVHCVRTSTLTYGETDLSVDVFARRVETYSNW